MEDDKNETAMNKKQWDQINTHLRQMKSCLDDTHSPLSTSPSNQGDGVTNAIIPRSHQPHNPHYRWSEGDLTKNDRPKIVNPPQSAPVLSEGYELKWTAPNSPSTRAKILKQPGNNMAWTHDDHTQHLNAQNIFVNGEPHASTSTPPIHHQISNHQFIKSKSASSVFHSQALPENNQALGKPDVFSDTNEITRRHLYNNRNTPGYNSGSNSPQVLRQISSPLLYHADPVKALPYVQFSSPGSSNSTNIQRQTVAQYKMSPSTRRKSAPVSDHLGYNVANQPRRAISQAGVVGPANMLPGYGPQDIFKPIVIPEAEPLSNVDDIANLLPGINLGSDIDSNTEDEEYTAALLQHQTDRMNRLRDEFSKKQANLAKLVKQVQILESHVMQRNQTNPLPLSSLQVDVSKLRDINRRLEIDCNCMYKEVDLFSRDGDRTRENFYSRYDRKTVHKPKKAPGRSFPTGPLPSPPIPPPQEKDDEPKWRCSHCTFDNHAALNKCEICEFPREVSSSRARNS